jgi:hypothetical protein
MKKQYTFEVIQVLKKTYEIEAESVKEAEDLLRERIKKHEPDEYEKGYQLIDESIEDVKVEPADEVVEF